MGDAKHEASRRPGELAERVRMKSRNRANPLFPLKARMTALPMLS